MGKYGNVWLQWAGGRRDFPRTLWSPKVEARHAAVREAESDTKVLIITFSSTTHSPLAIYAFLKSPKFKIKSLVIKVFIFFAMIYSLKIDHCNKQALRMFEEFTSSHFRFPMFTYFMIKELDGTWPTILHNRLA